MFQLRLSNTSLCLTSDKDTKTKGSLLILKSCLRMKNQVREARFEAFVMVKIQVKVFWVVMPNSVVVGYKHLTDVCCLHLQG
jgi:hypothetical protein